MKSLVRIHAAFLLLASGATAATVDVSTPLPIVCVDPRDGAEVGRLAGDGALTWDESSVPRLACDGPGLEPRDVGPGEDQTFLPAGRVTLRQPEPHPLRIEWLSVDTVVEVLAERSYQAATDLVIPVTEADDRWLRITRDGYAPVTLRPEPGEDGVLHLPKFRKGGEIFGRIPERDFMPEKIRTWLGNDEAVVSDRFFSLHTEPGSHHLRAHYVGGVVLPIRERVEVRSGESTWFTFSHVPPLAALSVLVSHDLCVGEPRIILLGNRDPLVEQDLDIQTCRARFEGLRPRKVTARVSHPEGVLATADVALGPGREHQIFLEANTPLVHGTVLMGGDPVPEARLDFRAPPDAVTVTADLTGRYRVRLPQAGTWSVSSAFGKYGYVRGERYEFVPGEQEVDIELPIGRLDIVVEADGGADKLAQVEVRGPRFASTIARLDETTEIAGLPLGSYEVEAYSSGLGASDLVKVELTDDAPVREVTLRLEPSVATLTILTSAGAPVAGATVRAGARRFRETGPGVFRLNDVRAGELVRIEAKGYEPKCVDAQVPQTRAVLTPAGPHRLEIKTPARNVGFALRGFIGSNCVVSRSDLPVQYTSDGIAILGLNPGIYTVHIAGRQISAQVPGPTIDLRDP